MYRLAIDVGGTFADGALVAVSEGDVWRAKSLTTPDRPGVAVARVVEDLLTQAGVGASDVDLVVHGTTVVANSLIERKGARTALLTTEGFRDVLELGADTRYDIYDLAIEFPEPLVSRAWRLEVPERTAPDGTVERAPAVAVLERHAAELRAANIDAVAVCFLHAYRNGENERFVRDALAAAAPGLDVSISSEVAPEIREFERTSTVVANAYVRPLVRRYLGEIASVLQRLGVRRPLLVMLSNGGVTSARAAARVPVRLVESGPAGGVLAAGHLGGRSGEGRLIAFDVGGTTAKVCFCDPQPAFTRRNEVARVRRHLAGSGLPLLVPSVDLVEIGAGGGSVARVGPGGLLRVGPESAGSAPGPICYGRGGDEPTVTDADLALGYLDADGFLGGRMPLDADAARDGLARLGVDLGLDALETAVGIREIVDNDMAAAVRLHAAERGVDASCFALFAFGGAGPVHAYEVARLLRLSRVVCPLGAGTGSALGFLIAPVAVDVARSLRAPLDALGWGRIDELYGGMWTEAAALLDGPRLDECTFERSVDVRYEGQGFEVGVAVDEVTWATRDGAALVAAFERTYVERYHARPAGRPVEAVTWRLRVTRRSDAVELAPGGVGRASPPERRLRLAFFAELGDVVETPVVDRSTLVPGASFCGPVIVEEVDSTLVVGPSGVCRVDEASNVVVELTRHAP